MKYCSHVQVINPLVLRQFFEFSGKFLRDTGRVRTRHLSPPVVRWSDIPVHPSTSQVSDIWPTVTIRQWVSAYHDPTKPEASSNPGKCLVASDLEDKIPDKKIPEINPKVVGSIPRAAFISRAVYPILTLSRMLIMKRTNTNGRIFHQTLYSPACSLNVYNRQ
jgi:hypothetical protein